MLGLIGPVTGGIGTGVALMTGGSLPPPALLAELDVVAGGNGVAVAVTGGSLPPPVMTGGNLPPPALLLLEEVATEPVTDGIEVGVAVMIGGCLMPLELVAEVEVARGPGLLAEVAIGPVGNEACVVTEGCWPELSGCFSAGLFSQCGCFTAGFMTRAVWPVAFSRASAGVLCSAVVTSMVAPSAQAADVVKSLRSFIDMFLSVPGRGAIRRH